MFVVVCSHVLGAHTKNSNIGFVINFKQDHPNLYTLFATSFKVSKQGKFNPIQGGGAKTPALIKLL